MAEINPILQGGAANCGYLIPLSCGHNGQFNTSEKLNYEAYLVNSSFTALL